MKKIIAIVLAFSSIFFLTATKTLADWSAGVSASVGHYTATGEEIEDGETNKTVSTNTLEGKFGYPSIFVEKSFGRVSIGLDVIPGSVETTEIGRTDYNIEPGQVCTGNDGCNTSVTNTAKVEISRHISLYALVPIMDTGAFIKAAIIRADVATKESLDTGSTYPDTDMKGASLSIGYQYDFDAAFVRAEVGATEYDTVSATSSAGHKVTADVDGDWARISIGKSF